MQNITIYIIPIVTLILGVIVSYFITKLKSDKENSVLLERLKLFSLEKKGKEEAMLSLERDLDSHRKDKELILIELTKKEAALANLQSKLEDQKEDITKLQEKFSKDFEILASKILEDKSQKFTAKNKENIELILNPLQEKIKSFEKKVEETNKESIERQSSLKEQIIGLSKLNERMSKDAVNLTKALKGDSKKQGDWGEFQLELLLERMFISLHKEDIEMKMKI